MRLFLGDGMRIEPCDIQTDGKIAKILYFFIQFGDLGVMLHVLYEWKVKRECILTH